MLFVILLLDELNFLSVSLAFPYSPPFILSINILFSLKNTRLFTINIYITNIPYAKGVVRALVNTGVEIDDNIDSRDEDFGRNEDDD